MLRKTSLFLVGILLPLASIACGPWLPDRLLENGGEKILAAPEFYFELEMKQLASHNPTPFKAVKVEKSVAESADYGDAVKTGRTKPTEPNGVAPQPKEFDLYDKGAGAFHGGKIDEARSVWKALLALPAEERHYRSTWAAYMLGRMNLDRPMSDAVKEGDEAKPSDLPSAEPPKTAQDLARDDEAVSYFRQVRELAQNGFADSLGLAASSLGWEAYVELHRGALDKGAELYLKQLSAGESGAVDSLRTVASTVQQETAANNPLLRRVKTAQILCNVPKYSSYGYPKDDHEDVKWLVAVEKANIEKVEEAERLGWLAYSTGRFEEAERWLKRADPEAGLALWLRAKLDFREGRVDQATSAMANALQKIPLSDKLERQVSEWEMMPSKVAAGDLGMLQLARSEFEAAFHAFLKGDHWQDAAFVAERILTVAELRKLVDKEFPAKAEDDAPDAKERERGWWYDRDSQADHRLDVRWMLARRLTRLGQFAEARPYFPLKYREMLDRYADALKRADNKKAQAGDRAKAFLETVIIARYGGMELMGAELEPDAFVWGGAYSESDVHGERLKGEYTKHEYNPSGVETKKVVVPVTEMEHKRLVSNKVEPEKRFHYRYTAADLAWRAAKLLPDNSELTADVLNTAGSWLKDRDDQAADRFLQAIERRCPNTEIGKDVLKRHWFVDKQGSWSSVAPQSFH